MKSENYIEDKVGRDNPFKVPEGYFESFMADVEAKLPPYPEVPKPERLSTWHRLRPYVYLAAMFAGIWCMMKVFHMATQMDSPLEAPAEHIAMVMESPEEYGVANPVSPQDDFETEMMVADSYSDVSEMTEDLNQLFKL